MRTSKSGLSLLLIDCVTPNTKEIVLLRELNVRNNNEEIFSCLDGGYDSRQCTSEFVSN
jgi:hypothetical protein